MRIAYYISSHGLGHAVRSSVIATALIGDHEVYLVTTANRGFLDETVRAPFRHRRASLDIGVAQTTPFEIDVQKTYRQARELEQRLPKLVESECVWLDSAGIEAVLVDIPAAACAAAKNVGLPVVAIANFTWDDIYQDYAKLLPEFGAIAERTSAQYAAADWLLELPFSTPMHAFARRRRIELVARRSLIGRAAARKRLNTSAPYVALVSLSADAFNILAASRWQVPQDWEIIWPNVSSALGSGGGVRCISNDVIRSRGLRFPDLVAASDVVISKPGYGITSECIANGAGLIYTDRGRFAEWDYIVSGIQSAMSCEYVSVHDLVMGKLTNLLRVFEEPSSPSGLNVMSDEEIVSSVSDVLGD